MTSDNLQSGESMKHDKNNPLPGEAMNIALDYDGTFERYPAFWSEFVSLCARYGNTVFIVTARHSQRDLTPDIIEAQKIVPVIFTNGVAKRWFLTHSDDGFSPDVWIDDKPESILHNSNMTVEELAAWRALR